MENNYNFVNDKLREIYIKSNKNKYNHFNNNNENTNSNNTPHSFSLHNNKKRFQDNVFVLSREKYEPYIDIDEITYTKTGKERRKRTLLKQFNSGIAQLLSNTQNNNPIYDFLFDIERNETQNTGATSMKDTFFSHIQCGIDEAGRGPLFGRVYSAGCIMLSDKAINWENETILECITREKYISLLNEIKDSKKYTSHKKLLEIYDFIKQFSLVYSIQYVEADEIDKINIRNATQKCMNAVMYEIYNKLTTNNINPLFSSSISLNFTIEKVLNNLLYLVDGCDFTRENRNEHNKYICIEGGDNVCTSIAAASILAKVERDNNIFEMCDTYPFLREKYHLDKHKGYGTKLHIDSIKQYGVTKWHRKTFGKCNGMKNFDETL